MERNWGGSTKFVLWWGPGVVLLNLRKLVASGLLPLLLLDWPLTKLGSKSPTWVVVWGYPPFSLASDLGTHPCPPKALGGLPNHLSFNLEVSMGRGEIRDFLTP